MITRKFTISAICLIMLVVNLYAQDEKSVREGSWTAPHKEEVIKKRIKTMTITFYGFVQESEKYVKKGNYKYAYEYDENGNETEYAVRKPNGKIYYRRTCDYDENGKLLDEEYEKCDELINSIKRKNDFIGVGGGGGSYRSWRDKNGRRVTEYRSFDDKNVLEYKDIENHDDDNNKIETIRYNPDGTLRERYTYKYDNKKNKIEEANYDTNGKLHSKLTYKYDEKGNMTEKTEYKIEDGKEIPQSQTTYEYIFYEKK